MWNPADHKIDVTQTAPNKNGDVKVTLTDIQSGVVESSFCKPSEVNETTEKLGKKLQAGIAKKAKEDSRKSGSSASKLV